MAKINELTTLSDEQKAALNELDSEVDFSQENFEGEMDGNQLKVYDPSQADEKWIIINSDGSPDSCGSNVEDWENNLWTWWTMNN